MPDPTRSRHELAGIALVFGRAGWVAKGVVFAIVGVVALSVAGGDAAGDEASKRGAVEEIAEQPAGSVALVVIGTGLFLYAAWLVVSALSPGGTDPISWLRRGADLVSAVVYALLAWSAVSFLTSSRSADATGESRLERASRGVLDQSLGRWLLGAAALVGLGIAARQVVEALRHDFLDSVDLTSASRRERLLVRRVGLVGWLGRSLTTALLASFVLQAAWNADSDDAKGLDGALRETAETGWGAWLVAAAGGRADRLRRARDHHRPPPDPGRSLTATTPWRRSLGRLGSGPEAGR